MMSISPWIREPLDELDVSLFKRTQSKADKAERTVSVSNRDPKNWKEKQNRQNRYELATASC
jgi:hypothetical protein